MHTVLAFEHMLYTVNEEDGSVEICIVKVGEVKETLSAFVETIDNTALGM